MKQNHLSNKMLSVSPRHSILLSFPNEISDNFLLGCLPHFRV